MSKIGRKPITIPAGVEVKIQPVDAEKQEVFLKGPKGSLNLLVPVFLDLKFADGFLEVSLKSGFEKGNVAFWGLHRSLLANAVEGVSQGFVKRLQIEGIGYRASLEGKNLNLSLGFSHPVSFTAPEGIEFKVEKNIISVAGVDKGLVGQVAAQIRALKEPEPYKGKGIRYENEVVRRKAGKKATATSG